MKKLIDIFLLRKLDRYLLKNYPTIWQTKGHYVLIYSLLINIPLFLYGYFITSTNNLTVPPIQQLFLNNDSSFNAGFVVATLFIIYWIFRQYTNSKQQVTFTAFIISLLIYLVCISAILLWNTTTYRLGTVYKSKGLMKQKDMDTLKANHFYMYGYVPECAKYSNIRESCNVSKVNFIAGNKKFKEIVLRENIILNNRYDLNALIDSIHTAWVGRYDFKDRSDLSYLSYRFYWLGQSSRESLRYMFGKYLSNLEHNWNLVDELNLSNRTYESCQFDLSYRSYISYLCYLSGLEDGFFSDSERIKTFDWNDGWEKLTSSNWFKDNEYDIHKMITIFNAKVDSQVNRIPKSLLNQYQIDSPLGSFSFGGIIFKHYPYLLALEDIVWSTQHAKQYINEGIWFKNSKMLLPFVLFFSLILSSIAFYRLEELAVGGYLVFLSLAAIVGFDEVILNDSILDPISSICIVGAIIMLIFMFFNFKSKFLYYTILSLIWILAGLLFSLVIKDLIGLNFELNKNNWKLLFSPFICTFIGLFAIFFIHQKPWAK